MRFKIFLLILFLFVAARQSAAEPSPYRRYNATDSYIFGAAVFGGMSALYLDTRLKPLTDEHIAALDRQNVNPFDRPATTYNSKAVADVSDWTMRASLALPFTLLAGKNMRKDVSSIALLYVQTMAVTGMITELTKVSVLRVRPYAYNPDVSLGSKKALDARKSFFSGHTSSSFAGTVFFARVFSDYNPDSKLKPYVWAGALTLSSVVAYSRVRAGRHFPTDVIAGAAVGGLVGYWIPELHKKKLSGAASAMSVQASPAFISVQIVF